MLVRGEDLLDDNSTKPEKPIRPGGNDHKRSAAAAAEILRDGGDNLTGNGREIGSAHLHLKLIGAAACQHQAIRGLPELDRLPVDDASINAGIPGEDHTTITTMLFRRRRKPFVGRPVEARRRDFLELPVSHLEGYDVQAAIPGDLPRIPSANVGVPDHQMRGRMCISVPLIFGNHMMGRDPEPGREPICKKQQLALCIRE
jgi:hypothetical protein